MKSVVKGGEQILLPRTRLRVPSYVPTRRARQSVMRTLRFDRVTKCLTGALGEDVDEKHESPGFGKQFAIEKGRISVPMWVDGGWIDA